MDISVIFTGGTIGSQISLDGMIHPDQSKPYQLLTMYKEKFGEDITFITREPYRILSENLDARHLSLLISVIKTVLVNEKVNGIVITHGTDTLQYTSAILGYVFATVNIPIMLVSSAYVLEDERANGLDNFVAAVEFIKQKKGNGVFVSYRNDDGRLFFHRGTRLHKAFEYSADVHSIFHSWYGEMVHGEILLNPAMIQKTPVFLDICKSDGTILNDKSQEILRIVPYVSMKYLDIPDQTKVILHESYHSGTICVSQDLKEFCDKAQKRGIPIFVTGLRSVEKEYETVAEYRKLGIEPIQDIAATSAYCKLWLALCNGHNLREVMKQEFAGESSFV